jgi:pyridoxine kinase
LLTGSQESNILEMDEQDLLEGIIPAKNLLALSSHVVHGYVGNDALQFPLNLRNWNVDCIYTTNLSAHPGHGSFTGGKVSAETVRSIVDGLRQLDLCINYEAIIVGYVASDDVLRIFWDDVLSKLNETRHTKVIMDPVMGDNGKVYVHERIVELYKKLLSSNEVKIDLLTPNQFEMELLTGVEIISWDTVLIALEEFCSKYPKIQNVVITSVAIDEEMYCIGASKGRKFFYKVDEVDAIFSGSGDLFLGILTDEFINSDGDLPTSLCKTIQIVSKVLSLSYQLVRMESKPRKEINGKTYIPDLKLVESRRCMVDEVMAFDPVFL